MYREDSKGCAVDMDATKMPDVFMAIGTPDDPSQRRNCSGGAKHQMVPLFLTDISLPFNFNERKQLWEEA